MRNFSIVKLQPYSLPTRNDYYTFTSTTSDIEFLDLLAVSSINHLILLYFKDTS